MRNLYSRHLEHFVAVYETQSIRGATTQGGASQAALSKSLKVLENLFSLTLFERHPNGMAPTAAAHVLYKQTLHIVNAARYLDMEMGRLRGGQTGTLRIGSGMVWGATEMPALLATMHQQFPWLEIVLHNGVSEVLTPMLLEGQLDVVIASLPNGPLPKGFSTIPLPGSPMSVFARTGHPLAQRRPVTLKQLTTADFVGFATDSNYLQQVNTVFGQAGLRAPRTIIQASSLETLLATVMASDSLVILPDALASRARTAGLTRLKMKDPLWQLQLGISYRNAAAELAPVQKLLDLASPRTPAR